MGFEIKMHFGNQELQSFEKTTNVSNRSYFLRIEIKYFKFAAKKYQPMS